MSRIPRARRTGASLFIGAVVGSLALAGCGAGQIAHTAQQVAATDGANASNGPVVVRNVLINYPSEQPVDGPVYARGASAPLDLVIINQSAEGDRLVSVTSPWASSVEVTGQTEVAAGRALVVGAGEETTAVDAAGTTPTPAAGSTPAPTTAPASTAPASPSTSVAEPGQESGEGAQIVLTGLLDDIVAGPTYEVVLTFENAGEVRVAAPLGPPEGAREDPAGEGH